MNGGGDEAPIAGKGKRKYYVGDDAVGVWRKGQEVDNFMQDGMGKPYIQLHPGVVHGERRNEE